MASFPDYVCIHFAGYAGYSEDFDPSVERIEMERSVPKQRLVNSQVMQELHATLQFKRPEDAIAFEQWYFDEIKRIGWFDILHPRTQQPISARVKGGSIGTLIPLMTRFKVSVRDVTLEYLR